MEKELEEHIKTKTAICLNILLNRNKSNPEFNKVDIANSYGRIASRAFVRKATVSNIFNAKTNPGTATLILIIEAMGFTIQDFAEIYVTIKEKEISEFESNNN
ncbi:MAG: hypothetical protein ABJ092_14815 [Gillisia sp.]